MTQPLHFLDRLARVTPQEAALAAELARDSVSVRAFLHKAREKDPALPDGPRFALPLSASPRRSVMIVSSDGNAVTCLGPEMPTHDAPEIPWPWVEAFSTQLREAVAAALVLRRDAGGGGTTVLQRLVETPGTITLADHAVLEALVPIVGGLLEECVVQATDLVRHDLVAFAEERVADGDHVGTRWWPRYLRGALAMLLGSPRAFPARAVVLHAATPDVHLAARASWCAVRRGTETLDVLEELADGQGLLGGEHELSVAVALETPLLSGRVRRFIRDHRHRSGAGYLELLLKALDDPRRALDHAVITVLPILPAVLVPDEAGPGSALSADALVDARRALGPTSELGFHDVARRMHKRLPPLLEAWLEGEPAKSVPLWQRFVRWTPLRFNAFPMGTLLCARAPREAFLPDEGGTADWAEERGAAYVRGVLASFVRRTPHARQAARPGPNAPCPCGSGKKYKRCHGAA